MPDLNEQLVFQHAPAQVRAAFTHRSARRHRFPAGTELYKFTDAAIVPTTRAGTGAPGRPISPWWCTVVPTFGPDDLGFDGLLRAADAAGVSPAAYARETLAVMFSWNTLAARQLPLARVQRIRLLQPVWGFFGRTQRQPNDWLPLRRSPAAARPAVSLAGGAWQVWLPNVTAGYYVDTALHLVP